MTSESNHRRAIGWAARLAVLAVLVGSATAQSCCDGLDALAARPPAWDNGGDAPWSVRVQASYEKRDGLQAGDSERSADQALARYMSIPVEMTMTRVDTIVGYAVNARFALSLDVPYVRNTMEMGMMMMGMYMEHTMDPLSGLGDVQALGSWKVFGSGDPATGQHALTLGLGLQAPTGEYDARTSSGSLIHASMQPGTGAWDPLAALEYAYTRGRWGGTASLFGQYATENPHGYAFGDAVTLAAAATYAPWDAVRLRLGPTFRHVGESDDRKNWHTNLDSLEDDPANTGGDTLAVASGVTVLFLRNLSLDVAASVPVWSRVNGIQAAPAAVYSAGLTLQF